MKYRLFFGVVAVCILFSVFSTHYHIPIIQTGTYILKDSSGTSSEVDVELTFNRYFFRPTLITGTIKLGDGIYTNTASHLMAKPLELLSMKIQEYTQKFFFGEMFQSENGNWDDTILLSGIQFDNSLNIASFTIHHSYTNTTWTLSETP